jgi:hypothetical protein
VLAYWFHERFGADATVLGPLFFGTNVLSAVSFLAASRVANRIGLLNTMVFTHLPSNLLLMLVPLMPSLPWAAAMLLARHLLSQVTTSRPGRLHADGALRGSGGNSAAAVQASPRAFARWPWLGLRCWVLRHGNALDRAPLFLAVAQGHVP